MVSGVPAAEAGQHAVNSLITGFDRATSAYVGAWQRWHADRRAPDISDPATRALFEFSAAVLRIHESKSFRGGVIASLSIPWGFDKGDADLGGYHLVWPRDLAETAGGFLAVGAHDDARRVLRFLQVTQDADGHWCQNMWLDGSPYWLGVQMDEIALPVLLVELAGRMGALKAGERHAYWPMVRRAVGFLVRNGPVSPQDRWEEDAGYTPFTLAAEIAALLVAADEADVHGEPDAARYLRETADTWHASLDRWMYVENTDLARRCGVEGYYVRVAEPDQATAASPTSGFVPIKNRPPSESRAPAESTVSPDALALVRFGLRAANDPRVVNTVRSDRRAPQVRDAAWIGVVSLQRRRIRGTRRRQSLRRHGYWPRLAPVDGRKSPLGIGGRPPRACNGTPAYAAGLRRRQPAHPRAGLGCTRRTRT